MRRLILVALAWSCLAARADEISALADRIAQLAEQSPIFGKIDTQIRAAELLMPTDPERAKKFLAAGLDLLRAHPEVRRGGAMFASMINLGVPDAEELMLAGKDRVDLYEQMMFYYFSHNQVDRAAGIVEKATREAVALNWQPVKRVLQDWAVTEPRKAAALRADVLAVALKRTPAGAPRIRLYGDVLAANGLSPDQQATLVDAAVKEFANIKSADEARNSAVGLLDSVEYVPMDDALFRRVVAAYVSADKDKINYTWLARLERNRRTSFGIDDPRMAAQTALLELAEVLQPHYDFSLSGLDGKQHSLSAQRGKVVLLNFWATWCPPCRAEMPLLERLHREWGPKGLRIMAVTDEAPEAAKAFLQQNRYTLPAFIDRERTVFDHYRIGSIPQTLIIDRRGRVIASPEALSEAELVRAFQSAGLE